MTNDLQTQITLYKNEYKAENDFKVTRIGGQRITMKYTLFGDFGVFYIKMYDENNNQIGMISINCTSDQVVEIFANLKTTVDLVHLDDFIDLLNKVIDNDLVGQHELFLVGRQSICLCDIIDIVSRRGSLNLRINQKAEKTFLHIENFRVRKTFDWEPKHLLE